MRLLVSVRSAAEVGPALAGGADIIDAKEPGRGSLGAGDRPTVLGRDRCSGPAPDRLQRCIGRLREPGRGPEAITSLPYRPGRRPST